MKKRLSLLMSIAIAVTMLFSGNVFAAFSDVGDDNPYKEAITTLSKLSVINGYEDNTFKPDGAITRAEFAKIIACTLGYQDIQSSDVIFSDVDDHWAKSYVNTCANLNIINGMGDGTFVPDSPVTYEQALKMVVCVLGHGQEAEDNGGYPAGYQNQAAALGLMKSISGVSYTDGAPRGVIAQLVYNALELDIYEKDILGNISNSEKTLLNDYLKVKKLKGVLAGVEDYITSECTVTLGNGDMDIKDSAGREYVIDYTSYTSDITEINAYLGKTITIYYRQVRDNDDRSLVIIDDESTKNNVITVTSEDIYKLDGNQFRYYVNDGTSTKSVKINLDDVSIRYNGKLVDSSTVTIKDGTSEEYVSPEEAVRAWLDPSDEDNFIYGTVKLTDSGADGVINLIEIEDYETLLAYKSPTTSDYRIQDKLRTANYLILDPTSALYTFTIDRNGSTIEVTSVQENDVVLYAKSLDEELYTVHVTASTVSGTIKSNSDNFSKITLDDGNEYDVKQSCFDYLKNVVGKEFKIGAKVTLYLDMFDNAVAANVEETDALPYAYIVSATQDDATDAGYITAYAPSTNASSAKTYQMATKVKVNGKSMNAAQVIAALKETSSNSNQDSAIAAQLYGSGKTPSYTATAQLVRIKISDNKVSEIITLSDDTEDEDGNIVQNVQNEDSEKLVRYRTIGQYYYSANSFREKATSSTSIFTTNAQTTVLYIPMNRNENNNYAKKTVSSAFTSGETYYVEAYNVGASKVASLIILYGSNGSLTKVTKTTDFSIVAKDLESIYNEDKDENVQSLSVYKGAVNTPTVWKTFDDTEFSDCVPGDVIQFAYDNDRLAQGRVNNIKFKDIASVLDDEDADVLYDWTAEQEPDEDNNYQSYVFDYRFKKADGSDETYTSTALGTVPYLRAYMGNVSQILTDTNKIYVTKNGFTKQNGDWVLDDEEYEEVSISSATKIIRMESNRKEFSRYVEDTTADLTYTDLRDAKNYGTDCNKVLVCTRQGVARLIVIYE